MHKQAPTFYLAIVCHAAAVLSLLFFVCSVEIVSVHKSVPSCVCPFNTHTTGGVVVFIYYINQTDLQQSYIFLLNGFRLTRGIITSQLM